MSYHMQNAQSQLSSIRPHRPALNHVSSFDALAGDEIIDEKPKHPQRHFVLKSLNEFDFSHLNDGQAKKLSQAINKALKWQRLVKEQKALSFVIAGGVGTGKTTIAQNLMSQFTDRVVIGSGDDDSYKSLLISALNRPDTPLSAKSSIQAMLENLGEQVTTVTAARFFECDELMGIMGDVVKGSCNLHGIMGAYRMAVIDDAGSEEIAYTSEKSDETKLSTVRAKRYSNFFNHCYNNGISVVITSNNPMVEKCEDGYRIRYDFRRIFGEKGFSRLQQMAKGYFVDLHGLPDYRPYLVSM